MCLPLLPDTYNSRAKHEQVIFPCSRGISSECINRRYWVRSAIAVILQIPRILFRDRVWRVFDFLDENKYHIFLAMEI